MFGLHERVWMRVTCLYDECHVGQPRVPEFERGHEDVRILLVEVIAGRRDPLDIFGRAVGRLPINEAHRFAVDYAAEGLGLVVERVGAKGRLEAHLHLVPWLVEVVLPRLRLVVRQHLAVGDCKSRLAIG